MSGFDSFKELINAYKIDFKEVGEGFLFDEFLDDLADTCWKMFSDNCYAIDFTEIGNSSEIFKHITSSCLNDSNFDICFAIWGEEKLLQKIKEELK